MKLKLNIDELNEDFFDDTRLLGIIAPTKNYHFCWQLNNSLGVKFTLNNDLEIHLRKKRRDYFFNIYQWQEPESFLVHYLYHNHHDGEYLLPEFKHIDFLWLMKGDFVENEKCQWIKNAIKNIASVQLVTELTNEQIKNKGNMVF
ncbi:MAG: IPExxxVDY family protein [Chitinophagaceae bacterium]|jgi:hypothetical protein